MSLSVEAKDSLDFGISREESTPERNAETFNLDRRKNLHCEPKSSSTPFVTPEFIYVGSIGKFLLVICLTAFVVNMISYDPSHSRPASQGIFSSVCFPTRTKCLLRLYLPDLLVNPPAIVFVTSVFGFFTLVFVLHGIRIADRFQDQILACGVVCGSILCGLLALQEGVSVFKNIMPAIITASLAISVIIHTLLG